MPLRKRRFEALEDRRLLAAWVGTASPAPAVVETASADGGSPAATRAVESDSDSSDGDSSDNYSEAAYAAAPQAAGDSPAPVDSYASSYYSSSYDSPSDGYTNNSDYSAKTPSHPTGQTNSSGQPATTSGQPVSPSPQPTVQPTGLDATNAAQPKASSAESLAFSMSAIGPGPTASLSAPAARSLGTDSIRPEYDASVAVSEPEAPDDAGADASPTAPVAPVALASWPSDWNRLAARAAAVEELVGAADQIALAEASHDSAASGAEGRLAGLLTGQGGANLAAIESGIDDVFERLERLGDELLAETAGASRFGQWVIVAAGACAAFEYARARYREGGPWQTAGGWPVMCEPRLRRRWFRRGRNH